MDASTSVAIVPSGRQQGGCRGCSELVEVRVSGPLLEAADPTAALSFGEGPQDLPDRRGRHLQHRADGGDDSGRPAVRRHASKYRYTGLDWFDARRDDLPKLTLKQAHRELQATGATVRLVPGEPSRSVASIANAHQHTGLLLLSSPVPDSSLAPAWFYFPRMIDAESVVLRERIDVANRPTFELLNHSLLAKQAATLGERKAA